MDEARPDGRWTGRVGQRTRRVAFVLDCTLPGQSEPQCLQGLTLFSVKTVGSEGDGAEPNLP